MAFGICYGQYSIVIGTLQLSKRLLSYNLQQLNFVLGQKSQICDTVTLIQYRRSSSSLLFFLRYFWVPVFTEQHLSY